MKNSKKIFMGTLSVIAVVAIFIGAFFYNSYNKRYDFTEKAAVAMGTIVTQKLYGENTQEYTERVKQLVDLLENKISFKKDDSVVAQINKGEAVSDNTVFSIVNVCKDISKDTNGAFDVTVGAVSSLWNIGDDDAKVPNEKEIEKLLKNVGYENIVTNGATVSLSSKCKMDLGAVGKGAACDIIKDYLQKTDVKGAVVSVGGSILAYGDYNKAGHKWQIGIRHPRNENEFLGVLSLDEGFVSTSGDYERYFEQDGKRYHHILNALTGYPSESELISVTVVCDSGVLSDALSTACFILGKEKSIDLLQKYNASAIFADSEMNISVVGDLDFEY